MDRFDLSVRNSLDCRLCSLEYFANALGMVYDQTYCIYAEIFAGHTEILNTKIA